MSWPVFNRTITNELHWKFNRFSKILQKCISNIVYKMTATLYRPPRVKPILLLKIFWGNFYFIEGYRPNWHRYYGIITSTSTAGCDYSCVPNFNISLVKSPLKLGLSMNNYFPQKTIDVIICPRPNSNSTTVFYWLRLCCSPLPWIVHDIDVIPCSPTLTSN